MDAETRSGATALGRTADQLTLLAVRFAIDFLRALDHSSASRGERSRSSSIRFDASAFVSDSSNSSPVSRHSPPLDADVPVPIQSVEVHGFEGLVAKRRNSAYEPGLRSGAWMKMRVNRAQAFVTGGYTRGTKTFDALVSVTTRVTSCFTLPVLATASRRRRARS